MLATEKDIPHLNYLLSLDEIFEPSVDDTFPTGRRWSLGRILFDDPSTLVLTPNEHCVIVATPCNSLSMYNVHIGVSKEGRGKQTIDNTKWAIKWFFKEYLNAHKLIAFIPTTNRVSQVFASLVGMEREGMCKKSFLKDGVLLDQIVYGLSREDT
jgi:hypothetical protein